MAKIISASELELFLNQNPLSKEGCIADTNILFAADYDLHSQNTVAIEICRLLYRNSIPIFTNVIVRSELLNLKRRVLVTEGLLTALKLGRSSLPLPLRNKLASLETKVNSHIKNKTHYFLHDKEIKSFRDDFESLVGPGAWVDFCKLFLNTKLHREWALQLQNRKVQYLTKESKILNKKLEWEDMINLVEDTAISANDALIVNLFLCSDLQLLITTDKDVVFSVSRLNTDKVLVCPDNLI